MQIEIQARGFPLTEAIGAYIERRIHFALSGRFDQIKRISVRLSDINGPRGGIDQRCQIHIAMPRRRDIVIEDTEADLYVAIDRAIDRAGRTLNRRLARQSWRKRKLFIPHQDTASPIVSDQYS